MAKNTDTLQAILLMAYGTPDKPADIEAYYTDIRRGNPPDAVLLKQLQDRYAAIGGTTPLRKLTEKQAMQLEKKIGVKTYIGMKHWHPYIKDTVEQMAKNGVEKITALVLAPHFSFMSIGDYAKRLNTAIVEIKPTMKVKFIEHWGDNKVFIDSL